MSRLAIVIAAFASLLMPSAVQAQDVIKTVTPTEVAEILKNAGYRAEIDTSTSRPFVRSGIGGHNAVVLLFDCKGEACSAIQFWAGLKKTDKFTVSLVEKWNSERRLAKAHLNKDGDLHFEYDIDLRGGVSKDYIKQATLLYQSLLARVDEFIKAAPVAPVAEIVNKAQQAEILAADGKFLEAVGILDDVTTALWVKAPLGFRRGLWVDAPAEGFGKYKAREDNVYEAGAKMVLYVEPFGYAWRKAGDEWDIDIVADLEVRVKDGDVVFRQREFQNLQLESHARNREFMLNFTYSFTGIPKGEYIADTTVRDRVTGKSATLSLPFVVQ